MDKRSSGMMAEEWRKQGFSSHAPCRSPVYVPLRATHSKNTGKPGQALLQESGNIDLPLDSGFVAEDAVGTARTQGL
jgi:hypothetical protein